MFETGLYNKFVVLIMFKRSAMEKLILVVICSVPAQSNDKKTPEELFCHCYWLRTDI